MTILWNLVMNAVLAVIFVLLNQWALQAQLEETFVFLALTYGITSTILNALYVVLLLRR